MMTRRQILVSSLAVPMLGAARPGLQIVADGDLLSAESAAGFRRAALSPVERPVLVFANARAWPPMLRKSPAVVECGPRFVGQRFQPGRYIRFEWPVPAMIRSFGPALEFGAKDGEPIAYAQGRPVAVRRGNLVALGAMLGPHLFAGDREAHELWNALLVRCAGRPCGGTSTTA